MADDKKKQQTDLPNPSDEAVSEPEQTKDIISKLEQAYGLSSKPEQPKEVDPEPEQLDDLFAQLKQLEDVDPEPEQPDVLFVEPQQAEDVIPEPEQPKVVIAEPEQLIKVVPEPDENDPEAIKRAQIEKKLQAKREKMAQKEQRDALRREKLAALEAEKRAKLPAHMDAADADKSTRQIMREGMQIRIRKLQRKRVNIFLVLLTIVLLITMFLLSGVLIPKAEPAAAEEPSKKTLTIDFVGDIMMGRYIAQYGEANGYSSYFDYVTPYFSKADYVVGNLEGAVLKDSPSSYKAKSDKDTMLSCNYDAVEALTQAGVNVFSTANSHSLDYGERPLTDLISYFSENNIIYSGIGVDINDAARYTILDCKGYRIAFVSITNVYGKNDFATAERAGVLSTAYGNHNQLIHDASEKADITIVYVNWGEENDITHNTKQRRVGHRMIDAGADIVIGTHPKVVQDIEKYKSGIIFYSLGNFVFDQGSSYSRDSVLVEMKVTKKGKTTFKLVPLRINDGVPTPTENFFYKSRILHELTHGLKEKDFTTDENGQVTVKMKGKFKKQAIDNAAAADSTDATDSTAPTAPAASTGAAAPTETAAITPTTQPDTRPAATTQ